MLKLVMDNLIIIIPCIVCLILFYMGSGKNQEGSIHERARPQENEEDFIPSEKFIGEKSGYIFKNDNKGLGYYKDHFNIS